MKKVLLAFAILLLVVGGIYLTQNYQKAGGTFSFFKKTATVTIDNHSFNVFIAASEQERIDGLSKTKSLALNQGMIFLFDKSDYYSFWMKNMKFPIDIIFINNDQVVTIQSNAQIVKAQENPTIYASTAPANKVLEIQVGLSKKYNFKNGDKVTYENLGN